LHCGDEPNRREESSSRDFCTEHREDGSQTSSRGSDGGERETGSICNAGQYRVSVIEGKDTCSHRQRERDNCQIRAAPQGDRHETTCSRLDNRSLKDAQPRSTDADTQDELDAMRLALRETDFGTWLALAAVVLAGSVIHRSSLAMILRRWTHLCGRNAGPTDAIDALSSRFEHIVTPCVGENTPVR